MGALAKDPAARWQSAEDFAEALEACRPYVEAQGEEVSPGHRGVRPRAGARGRARGGRRAAAATAARSDGAPAALAHVHAGAARARC